MISLAQTLVYAQLCHENKIPVIPRSRDAMMELYKLVPESDHVILDGLINSPETAEAYMELIRTQISLRKMGFLPMDHPAAMINMSNFQKWLASISSPEDVHAKVQPYGIGNLEKWGAFLPIADRWYKELDAKNSIEEVLEKCNLSRLLSLYEYIESDFDSSIVAEVVTPVNLPHIHGAPKK